MSHSALRSIVQYLTIIPGDYGRSSAIGMTRPTRFKTDGVQSVCVSPAHCRVPPRELYFQQNRFTASSVASIQLRLFAYRLNCHFPGRSLSVTRTETRLRVRLGRRGDPDHAALASEGASVTQRRPLKPIDALSETAIVLIVDDDDLVASP